MTPKSVIAPGRVIRVGRGPSYASQEALREARARRPRRVPSKHFRPGYRSVYGKVVEEIIAQGGQPDPSKRRETSFLGWLGLVRKRTQNFGGGVGDWIDDREELAGPEKVSRRPRRTWARRRGSCHLARSRGFYGQGKVQGADGRRFQVSVNVVEIGSKPSSR